MGASIPSGGGTSGRRKRTRHQRHQPMSEINVTPFVDVMLVLLVIFMVTAPMMTAGVPLDLPDSRAKSLSTSKSEPLTISVDRKGRTFIQEAEFKPDEIVPKLLAIGKNDKEKTIFVRADRDVDYGKVMRVMGLISAAGFRKISLISNIDTGS